MFTSRAEWLFVGLAVCALALLAEQAVASTVASVPVGVTKAASAEPEATLPGAGSALNKGAERHVVAPFNPFGDWQTHELANGMRVWLKDWPGADEVRTSLSLPVGADHDPEGLEGLAHYLEHVLFTSVPGQTEAEFKKSISDRGGTYNGTTGSVATWYWNQLPASEWRFGIKWVHDTVFGKEFHAENIRKQLAPVLLEGGSSVQPEGFDDLMEALIEPKWSAPPTWLEREFGLKRDIRPTIGTWESLHSIEPDDVRGFYEQHYHANAMRLVVVGDIEIHETLAYIEELFGAYPRGNAVPAYRRQAQGPERRLVTYDWKNRQDSEYKLSFKLHDLSADDYIRAFLFGELMRIRLNRKLRWGEEKSTYSISLKLTAVYGSREVTLSTNCPAERLEEVRTAFNEVFNDFTDPKDPVVFDEARDELVARLRRGNPTPGTLVANWVEIEPVLHPDVFESMPDVLGLATSLGPSELAAWLSRHVRPERMTESITRTKPLPEGIVVLELFLCFWLALVVLRRRLIRPVDLRRLRYFRKLQYPPLQWLVGIIVWILGLNAIGLVSTFTDNRVELLTERVPSFLAYYSCSMLTGFLSIVAMLLLGTVIPRKVLLLEEQFLLKFWSWRSLSRRYDEVDEVQVLSLWELWRRGAWLTLPLSAYLWKRGVYLRRGRVGVLLHTRQPEELASVVQEGIERCASPPPSEESASSAVLT